jgi:hypothetical protein
MTGDESLTAALTAALAAEADYRTAKAHADAVRGSRAYEAANAAYSDALDRRVVVNVALDVAVSSAYAAYAAKELP